MATTIGRNSPSLAELQEKFLAARQEITEATEAVENCSIAVSTAEEELEGQKATTTKDSPRRHQSLLIYREEALKKAKEALRAAENRLAKAREAIYQIELEVLDAQAEDTAPICKEEAENGITAEQYEALQKLESRQLAIESKVLRLLNWHLNPPEPITRTGMEDTRYYYVWQRTPTEAACCFVTICLRNKRGCFVAKFNDELEVELFQSTDSTTPIRLN